MRKEKRIEKRELITFEQTIHETVINVTNVSLCLR